MIKLTPTAGTKTFSIIPSSFVSTDLDGASIVFINDETNVQDDSATFTWELSANENYVEISLTPSVTLVEGQFYTLELSDSTDVYYRDIVYITTETNKKDVYTLPDIYEEYDDGDDEYIVL